MSELKLTIDMLPKGAWNNDLSRTLPKKDWDTLREHCYKKANKKCQICGYETDELDAHEIWEFNKTNQTQTLKDIIGICTKCHGVKHFRNSIRLGYGNQAKAHFLHINKCSEMEFANHLNKSLIEYEELNKVYRWKMIVDLNQFGGKNIKINSKCTPLIIDPYKNIMWNKLTYSDIKDLFQITKNDNLIGAPKIISIKVDNYQGKITINSNFTDKIEWFLDDKLIKTKYNIVGNFSTELKVDDLNGKQLHFKLTNQNGYIISKNFVLEKISN